MTARDAAKDLIKTYVLRGDTVEQLKAGYQGAYSDRYGAHIGGYGSQSGKKYSWDWIIVERLGKKNIEQAFKLVDIYKEIQGGQLQLL